MTSFLLLLLLQPSWASDANCEKIATYHDFFECSLQRHPEFEASRLKVREGDAIREQALQWENPSVNMKTVTGKQAGENVGDTEVDLTVSVSQLWTRGAKKAIGEADKKIAEIDSLSNLLTVKRQLIKDLYRFRQVDSELSLVKEALDAFDRIKTQYRGRLARGPEQEITLNLVELATSDYELRKNHLTIEKSEIIARLKGLWGPTFEFKKEYFPPERLNWPEVPSIQNMAQNFESRKSLAETEKAMAEQSLARRESWPQVSAGPSLIRTTEGPTQVSSYGVNVNVSVPIFSLNGGSRKLADVRYEQSKLLSDYANKKAQLEKEIVLQKYRSAVDSLKKSTASDDVIKKHNRIDGLFRQGLASGSIIIEAHRQIIEYTESQHEHEIAAIDAYLEIKALTSNENLEDILK